MFIMFDNLAISCYNGTFLKTPLTPKLVIPTNAELAKVPVVTGCKACAVSKK